MSLTVKLIKNEKNLTKRKEFFCGSFKLRRWPESGPDSS